MAERARWGTGRKLLLQLALLPVLMLVVEVGYRGLKRVRGERHDPVAAELEMRRIGEAVAMPLVAFNAVREDEREGEGLNPRRIPSPFYGWEYENRFRYLTMVASRFDRPEAEDTFDVMILGGSVAAGFGVFQREQLKRAFAADARLAGREIVIENLGIGGFKQPQQLNKLVYLMSLGWKPDAVINLDGFNEVALGNTNASSGAHPLHPSIAHWGHLLAFGRASDEMLATMWRLREAKLEPLRIAAQYGSHRFLHASAFLTDLWRYRVRFARRRYADANDAYTDALDALGREAHLFGPPAPEAGAAAVELLVEGWYEGSRSLQAICDQAGIHYLHVLQPTLHDPGSKPLTPGEVRTGRAGPTWVEGVREGYPRLRAAGARLTEAGVNFLDASMVFAEVTEDVYVDACHFEELGNALLGDLVAERFLATLP